MVQDKEAEVDKETETEMAKEKVDNDELHFAQYLF